MEAICTGCHRMERVVTRMPEACPCGGEWRRLPDPMPRGESFTLTPLDKKLLRKARIAADDATS